MVSNPVDAMKSMIHYLLSNVRKCISQPSTWCHHNITPVGSSTKHLLHVTLLLLFILAFEIAAGGIPVLGNFRKEFIDPWTEYGSVLTVFLYFVRFLTLLPLPLSIFQFCGLVFYNAFPNKPLLKKNPVLCPFICIRVVTRGDYPTLVKNNVMRNMNVCLDLSMDKFIIEVATDKAIHLPHNPRIREIVVPKDYVSKNQTLFKARALQYCLEEGVNMLNGDDYIVHLDEETLLTDNSVRGILNFAADNKYDFGQGLVTYANEEIVNWLTTLADMFRIADDMGRLRFQFKCFHKPIFNWKGSYVVTKCCKEREITYDNGPEGSVAEDCYFALNAAAQGCTFDWIEGEMWEKSPFTVWDFLQQRKRWIQGMYLSIHSKNIPFRVKYAIGFSLYAWLSLPLSTSNLVLAALYPIPCGPLWDFVTCIVGAVQLYMYIFGVLKSFNVFRIGIIRWIIYTIGSLCTIPFNIVIENVAVIWGIIGYKKKFYVVKKELKPVVEV